MALDVNKLRQTQSTTSVESTSTAAVASNGSSSKPIDLKSSTLSEDEKCKQLLEFTNSAEYKNCPDKDKLELLKQQFPYLNNYTDSDLQKYVNLLRNRASNSAGNSSAAGKQDSKTDETKTSVRTDNSSATGSVKTDSKAAELEDLALKYAQENKLEENIDEIIRAIKMKSTRGETLTETEQKILNIHSSQKEPVAQKKPAAKKEYVAPVDIYFKEEFQQKSQSEKVGYVMDLYLTKNDPEYSKITDPKQKEEYLFNKWGALGAYVESTESLEDKNQDEIALRDSRYSKCIAAMQIAQDRGISIDDVMKMDSKEFNDEATKNENAMIKLAYDKLNSSPNFRTKPAEEKIDALYHILLVTKGNEEYAQLSPKEKKEYREKEIEKMILNEVDVYSSGQKKISKQDEKMYTDILYETFDSVIRQCDGKTESVFETIAQINSITEPELRDQIRLEYIKSDVAGATSADSSMVRKRQTLAEAEFRTNINDELKGKSAEERIEILQEMLANETNPTNRKFLKSIIRNETMQQEVNPDGEHKRWEKKTKLQSNTHYYLQENGIESNLEDSVKEEFAKLDKDNFDNKKWQKRLKIYIARAYHALSIEERESEIALLRQLCLEKGIPEEEFEALLKSEELSCHRLGYAQNGVDLGHHLNEVAADPTNEENMALAAAAAGAVSHIYSEELPELVNVVETTAENDFLQDNIAAGMGENLTVEQNQITFDLISQSEIMTEGQTAEFTESFTEQLGSDKDKIIYEQVLSQIGNSAIMEGLAASADSFKDNNLKQEFTANVQHHVQSYPPELIEMANKALSTGKISNETRTSQRPSVSAYCSEADTYTPPVSTSNTSSANAKSTNSVKINAYTNPTPSGESTVVQASVGDQSCVTNPNTYTGGYSNSDVVTPNHTTTVQSSGISNLNTTLNTSSSFDNPIKSNGVSSGINQSAPISSESTPSYTVRNEAASINAQVQANEQMKEAAMENVAQVKEEIEEAIEEWELKEQLELTEEAIEAIKQAAISDTIKEYIESNPSTNEVLINKLANAESISEVYDILLAEMGSNVKQKFIDNLASYGSANNIREFISSKGSDNKVVKQLYLKTSSASLKSELLDMLPESDILAMLDNNDISTLNDVDHNILFTYVSKNLYSMTQTNFANFLKHLPLDERQKLIAMRNKSLGNNARSQEHTVTINAEVQSNRTGDVSQAKRTSIKVNSQPQEPRNADNKNKENINKSQNPQTTFKAGETRKTLADGRVITNQGTTFAGVSNNASNDEGYKVVNPKEEKLQQAGAPIGMDDKVLTPGSPEWYRKYNKQQTQTVAFTMSALEQQDDGPNLSSNKVKMGQPIKKKYNPNGFNIRG